MNRKMHYLLIPKRCNTIEFSLMVMVKFRGLLIFLGIINQNNIEIKKTKFVFFSFLTRAAHEIIKEVLFHIS